MEFYTLSKAYNMPGWRVGFCVGNREVVGALAKIKSYLDYGIFQPIQIASTVALNGPQDCVKEVVQRYQNRRNVLVNGLNRIGWQVGLPRATMFVWARIPDPFRHMGSLEFSKLLTEKAKWQCPRESGLAKAKTSLCDLPWWKINIRTPRYTRYNPKVLKMDDRDEGKRKWDRIDRVEDA